MKNILLLTALSLLTLVGRSQSSDPYAVFGHNTTVKYEERAKDFLYIKNTDPCSDIRAIYFDGGNHVACLLGDYDSILKCFDLPANEQFTWISVDPKADKYPSLSPYNYVGNNPMNAIDPDGRYILPLNAGAKQIMTQSKQQYGDLLDIRINDRNGNYFTGANFGSISALRARVTEMKLDMSNSEINDAWALYSGLNSNKVYEVQTTTTQTQGDYAYNFDQGGGTYYEGGGSNVNNSQFDKLMGIIKQGGLTENTAKSLYDPKSNGEGPNTVSPDAKGKGWAFFLNEGYDQSKNPVQGQIMLDKTGKTGSQVFKSLCNALNGLVE